MSLPPTSIIWWRQSRYNCSFPNPPCCEFSQALDGKALGIWNFLVESCKNVCANISWWWGLVTFKCSGAFQNGCIGFPGGSDSKSSTCNAGDLGSIPGSGRSPGGGIGNPLLYSCLEYAMDGGSWQNGCISPYTDGTFVCLMCPPSNICLWRLLI